MATDRVSIGQMADAIMEGLEKYASLATDDLKASVRKAGKTVKDEIAATAPKDTGKYAKSWAVKTQKETSNSLELVVHSKKPLSAGPPSGNLVMRSEVVAVSPQGPISHQRKKRRLIHWSVKLKRP